MNHLEIYYDDAEFRTIICPDFLKNKCRWQKQKYCKYAHGEHNLRCKEYLTKGKCSKGEFCPLVHKKNFNIFFEEHGKIKKYGGFSVEMLKTLKNIDIDISQNYCGRKGIEFLVDGFRRYLTGLEEICLNLAKNNLDPEALGILRKGILIFQQDLKVLKLNLSSNAFKDVGVENLLLGLEKISSKQFNELIINFSQNGLKDGSILIISKILPFFKENLIKLNLDFSINFLKEDSMKYLAQGLSSMSQNLQELSINLSNNKMDFKALEYLANEGKSIISHLDSFSFNINSWDICPQGTDILIKFLSNLSHNITTLRLDIGRNKLNIAAFKKILKILKPFIKLRHFELNISKNIIEDEGIDGLALILKDYTNLITLKLNLALCDFKKKGMFSISNALTVIGKNLVLLEANFSMNAFEIEGMDGFVTTLLKYGKNLVTLNLKFYKNFIGKEGQKMIIDCLKMVKIKRYMFNIAYNFDKKIKNTFKKKILKDLLNLYAFSSFDSQEVMDEYFGDYAEASAYIEDYKEDDI